MKKIIDKLAYIFIKDGRILMTLSRGKDTWYIPGGKREGRESDFEALYREISEELSVQLLEPTVKKYGVFEAQAHGHPAGTTVRMTCYTAEHSGELKASSEIERFDFFPYERKHESSMVDHLIFEDLRKKGLL